MTMRGHRAMGFGAAIACALVAGSAAQAAAVSIRLGTGLLQRPPAGALPEIWVAPSGAAPAIDGRLDDAAWAATMPSVLGKLESYGEAMPRTEVRLVHRAGVLYAGIALAEPNIDRLKETVRDLDGPAYGDDSVEFFLSPSPGEGYFQIIASASGAVFDRVGHDEPARWNSGARAAVEIGKDGWSVEIAIPMSALGIAGEIPGRWRGNIYRNRQATEDGKSESQAFSPTFRGDYDVPERFGYFLFTPEPPWADREGAPSAPRGIEIVDIGVGSPCLLFDLSRVPKNARIYRAHLRCERDPMDGLHEDVLKPVEIVPVDEGSGPLKLVPPWYDRFDMTGNVRRLLVKSFPGWRKDRTFLDILFEGEPRDVPQAVTNVRAFHRAGQTFITWKEIEDPVGRDQVTWDDMRAILNDLDRRREVRYVIYRSNEPITAESFPNAERIAEVKPLSGWDIDGRNIDRPIDRFIATARNLNWHQWNPFQVATIDGEYGRDCPIERFVAPDGVRLARGTGLYVHTAAQDGKAYYAVVTSIDGIENTRDFGGGATVAGPIDERRADPEPVLQGELPRMPFFNYDQRRLHYVQWVAPPMTNRPSAYFNWSVGVPNDLAPGAALELNLHRDGYSFWRTHYRIEPGSVVLCPYDFPAKTWWYGYPEALGTLRSWRDGVIRNYTERRLLAFIGWAARTWPVDRRRITATGCRGGASGSGALLLGLRNPDVFNLVIAGHGHARYGGLGEEVERIWGKVAWGLETETGRSVWEELDLVRLVESLPGRTDLPFMSATFSEGQKDTGDLVRALMARGHAVVWDTMWGGQRMIPISATTTTWCLPLDIRKDLPMLAVASVERREDAIRNGSILWETRDIVDGPGRFAMTIRQTYGEFKGTVVLRRTKDLDLRPGRRYRWTIGKTEGTVRIGEEGVLALRDIAIAAGTHRLAIEAGE